ncbi:hypothetical protein PMAYCL1PPCAC_05682, partial [Pristionchus mayeri]
VTAPLTAVLPTIPIVGAPIATVMEGVTNANNIVNTAAATAGSVENLANKAVDAVTAPLTALLPTISIVGTAVATVGGGVASTAD